MIYKSGKKYDALLIDLDGTLLEIDLEKFILAYVDLLSKRFKKYLEREDFIAHLFGSTAVMVESTDPNKQNRVVFYEDFCQRIDMSLDEIEPIIDQFYKNDFPTLSCWGREHPSARAVVEASRSKNLRLVLATNPLFPSTAVLQRLSWAGLAENDFMLITSMDNMHFCKPKPQYYHEIADKIGCSPENCLMAGNDTLEDLIAAETGMDTFLVEDSILQRSEEEPYCDYRGKLKDLVSLLKSL
jgi:FMN phosphatase YigB (HAD superfamily)